MYLQKEEKGGKKLGKKIDTEYKGREKAHKGVNPDTCSTHGFDPGHLRRSLRQR